MQLMKALCINYDVLYVFADVQKHKKIYNQV